MGCHFLLQGIFPTQGSNLSLQHCRQMLYRLSHQGSPSEFNRYFNEYSGFVSFRIDWFDLLIVQGTLKSLLEAAVFWCSVFFMVQLSHMYMTIGKIIALTPWTFVSKVMRLLFNMLSRFIIAFPLRSKHLLILWLWSLSTVVLEPKKIKSVTHHFFPSICHEVMELDAMILVFFMLSFKPTFSLSSFTLIKTFFNSSSLSAFRMISPAYLRFLVLQSL